MPENRHNPGEDDGRGGATPTKALGLIERIMGLGRKTIDQLPTGEREGKSAFLKFVSVSFGMAILITAGVLARATDADTLKVALTLISTSPDVALYILGGCLVSMFILSGLIAHGHTNVTYGRCIRVGMIWGGTIVLIFALLPLYHSVAKLWNL